VEKTVYVVSTLHRYQGTFFPPFAIASKEQLEQFKRFLKEIIDHHDIRWVGEEMNCAALEKYPHPDLPPKKSTPLLVAAELNRPHKYCDPPGLPEDKREPHWLHEIESFNLFPCLFVLASDHARSFRDRLNESGLNAILKEWMPTS
jgi:hypothetical protein